MAVNKTLKNTKKAKQLKKRKKSEIYFSKNQKNGKVYKHQFFDKSTNETKKEEQ